MKSISVLFVSCLLLVCVTAEQEMTAQEHQEFLNEMKAEHPIRDASRPVPSLSNELLDRANLFFRSIDADFDKYVSIDDIDSTSPHLSQHVPGVTAAEFKAFIELADRNGDKKLDQDEFIEGLARGMKSASLIETDANAKKVGFLGDIANNAISHVKSAFRKMTGQIDTSNDGCVMCQYIIERCETNIKQSGVIPAITGAQSGPSVFLEIEQEQNPFDVVASNVIGNTRLSTRYQRQLERQKYNEIYRVVDITLDDVCEQGMPNSFYAHCKAVYQSQSDVVDGLRYQYRPSDICFRIGMCAKSSYITKGVHSRYAQK